MGNQDFNKLAKGNIALWRFIGQVTLNQSTDKFINIGDMKIATEWLQNILNDNDEISGFSGISIQKSKSSVGKDINFHWRVGYSNEPQKGFSFLKYGYKKAFHMAFYARVKLLGLDIDITGIHPPDTKLVAKHIQSRLSSQEWKENKVRILELLDS